MADVTQDYIDQEESNQRRPVELYHFWLDGGQDWRYTDGDIPVTYDSNVYSPAVLSRGSIRYNSTLEAQTLTIYASYLEDATINFLTMNPIEILWASVMKLHRDQDPLEADVLFIGQIKTVLFKGKKANINCVGFEHFLKKMVPNWRYQLNCNHEVFDDKCSLVKADYKVTTAVTVGLKGLTLVSDDFALQDDGFYIGGEVVFGTESRTIINHAGTNIVLMYKFLTLASTDSVDVYPGCDGRKETCRDKFDNILNFLGFPYIPNENPALRVTW